MNNYKYYELPVCYLTSGLELELPVHEISGSEGPVIGISACLHGDEKIGIEIIRRVLEVLKSTEITGTIKMMPVSNPISFEAKSRINLLDGKNMNRIFPGDANGTVVDRLAKVMAEQYLDSLDAYIDIHAGGEDPIVDYVIISNDEGFARASLSKILYRPQKQIGGSACAYLVNKGIPSVILEFGGGPNDEYYIELGVNGILNMLRYKKAIAGAAQTRGDQIVVTHIENINPHHGGLLVPSFTFEKMTSIIEGKVTLAKIYNPMTLELLEELKSPFDKNLVILMRGALNTVFPGDYAFMIGDMASAE